MTAYYTKPARRTFTDADGWNALIEVRSKLADQVLGMCATLEDVRRCADMGDFRIIEVGPATA